jgi:two-component system CheB/CheR fusion protein
MSAGKKEVAPLEIKNKMSVAEKVLPSAPQNEHVPEAASRGFYVVGIGSSAGGLETLEEFFKKLPANTGMAFVVVSHQQSGHVSLLPDLLGKYAPISVVEAIDGVLLRPNHVYVSPPGAHLGVMNRRLQLMEGPSNEMPPLPIDFFFRSLATDLREHAICIVLSGTGTDGTLGLKAVKGEAGMAMVQDVQSARFGGMPASAISTTMADYVLPPAGMPAQLVDYATGMAQHRPAFDGIEPDREPGEPLQKIFMLLRTRTGHDFSSYKQNSILRRIERRMTVHHVDDPNQYVRLLQEYPHEIDLLFNELLIGVTCFFRDPEAFALLRETVFPELLTQLSIPYTFRVWIPGCASGEEAYTLAILLHECAQELSKPIDIQIFATDLSVSSIEYARLGRYPDGIAADVPADLLKRHFIHEDGGYRVRREIRERIVFAQQNVIKDPPFTKLDLLCCRNLLIYLNGDLQKRLLPIFHYALKPGSIMVLGPSETVGQYGDLFASMDRKWKVFRRLDAPVTYPLPQIPAQAVVMPRPQPLRAEPLGAVKKGLPVAAQLQEILLDRFAPPSLVVNSRGDIIYIHGRTGAYLEPCAGQPRMNIHDMARDDLALALGSAMRQAVTQEKEVLRERVRVGTNGREEHINLSVVEIAEPDAMRGLLLISFHPVPPPEDIPAKPRHKGRKGAQHAADERMQYLEREIQFTRQSLQRTVEELETGSEELKSANEELQSANEELQSTNEELETSKEELQSLNEELSTVNAELQCKLDELSHANDDMQNLLNSTNIATIFLDDELHIKRYTEQAKALVNLIPADVGRPIGDLVSSLEYDSLEQDARKVLKTLVFCEHEVRSENGTWYLMRIMPYRTAENLIQGLTLTFVEIIATQQEQVVSREVIRYLQSIFDTIHEPTLLMDGELRVAVANRAFYETFQVDAQNAEGTLIYEVGSGQWDIKRLRQLLEEIIPEKTVMENFAMQSDIADIERRSYLLNARQLPREIGLPEMILLSIKVQHQGG